MKRLSFLIMILFLIPHLSVFSSEEELRIIDERISQIEQKLEIIKGKEKEYDDITRELGRAKYKVLIRRERELKKKQEELKNELEPLLEEKTNLLKELDGLKAKRKELGY